MELFEELGLSDSLLKSVQDLGFEEPTPVQKDIIPLVMKEDADVVVLSQTGTGKTAAFGLPLLSMLDFSSKDTQALILCPTRELCMQIARDITSFAKYLKKVNVTAVYGGASIVNQMKELKKGSQIIVGTPGRMIDLIRRKKINLKKIDYLVLDEADEMLNMGFKEDLDTILSQTSDNKHTWLFSATMPDEVLRISRQYMYQPIEKTFGGKNSGNKNISHVYYSVRPRDRYAALKRLADFQPEMFGIVFCRTRRETKDIADRLIKDGYSADALHGELSQGQRDHVMNRYRNHLIQMLVATDVAARGIDVNDITHVIHYSLPDELENYTHRSGRTARAGKEGTSVVLAGSSDVRRIRSIEKRIKSKFEKKSLPSAEQVKGKQLFRVVNNIQNCVPDEKNIEKVLPEAYSCLDYMSREDLIQRMLTLEFERMPKVHDVDIKEMNHKGAEKDGGEQKRVKLFVNLGAYDGLNRKKLVTFIAHHSGVREKAIEIVEFKNSFCLLRVKKELAKKIIFGLKDVHMGDRQVRAEIRRKKGPQGKRKGFQGKRKGAQRKKRSFKKQN